jgi:hypothetical protein
MLTINVYKKSQNNTQIQKSLSTNRSSETQAQQKTRPPDIYTNTIFLLLIFINITILFYMSKFI